MMNPLCIQNDFSILYVSRNPVNREMTFVSQDVHYNTQMYIQKCYKPAS